MEAQLIVQMQGILATLLYTAVLTYLILRVVKALVGFRVSVEEETTGLDIVLHDERGYDL
jgi:ammonium transporter, Amt family